MTTEIVMPLHALSYEKIPTTIYSLQDDACKKVAYEIAQLVREKLLTNQQAVIGFATGSTPKKIYTELVRLHREENLSFKNVIAFNLDEYYPINTESLQSFARFMEENLFNHIDIDRDNCFIPHGNIPGELIKRHCEAFEKKIADYGGIDLQILGIGRNGHIGFNEPGSNINSITRLITLDQNTRSDAQFAFDGLAGVPRKAITMGVGTILNAKRIILLAFGENKAGIIKQTIEGPSTEFVPASYLQGHKNVECIIDEAAAAELTRRKAPWLTEEVNWNEQMVKKAVIHLALTVNKPILKLTGNDYNENGLSDLLALFGQPYDINIDVFNRLQHTITGWPGGKHDADDSNRPERSLPAKKRVLIFSPHPDDDIISMGGTFQRLVDQGHEVHVAYQTSGNIAVADDEALRFIEFANDFNSHFKIGISESANIYQGISEFLAKKKDGEADCIDLRTVKGLIRRSEAINTCRFVGIPMHRVHFLNLPFYDTGTVVKNPLGTVDIARITSLIESIQPHQMYAAGDLADPHGTHKVCLDAIIKSVESLNAHSYMKDCWIWLYKGAWAEWDIHQIEMAVPMSPDQVLKKRNGIFKHQSQKDGAMFQGMDNREFWQRAEIRNRKTADLYNKLGLAEYEAIEAFVRWR